MSSATLSQLNASADSKNPALAQPSTTTEPASAMTTPLSRTATFDPEASAPTIHLPSDARRNTLLFFFSLAQFIDIFGASAVIVGLSQIAEDLDMTVAESIWVVNAYALTLAATLLTGGRIADLYNPKIVFIVGFLVLGLGNLGVGLSKYGDKVALLVLRALSGLGAAQTIPAATNLIIHLFPEPDKQANAIAIFGGSGAIANIFGLIIGGALLLGGWSWIFYFSTIIAIPLSLSCIWLIPDPKSINHHPAELKIVKEGVEEAPSRQPKMDYLGTFLQTAAIVLLIYGLTEANVKGWRDPGTIATVVIGGLLFFVFFYWQSKIDPIDALLAPELWRIKNFTLITVFGVSIGYWFFETQVSFSDRFQGLWGISGIMTAVRFLPCGLAATASIIISQGISLTAFPLKIRLQVGPLLGAVAMLLFSFVDGRDDYWRLIFPGLVVGAIGVGMAFVSGYVALLQSVPPQHSGVAGGVWNSILQLGAAALLSITSTIQVAFPEHPGDIAPTLRGYKGGYWFCLGMMVLDAIIVAIFFVDPIKLKAAAAQGGEGTEGEKGEEKQ